LSWPSTQADCQLPRRVFNDTGDPQRCQHSIRELPTDMTQYIA